MAFDEQTYKAHRLAQEGKVFYYNRLAEPQYAMTYFPPPPTNADVTPTHNMRIGESANYERRPRISMPFTRNVINRVASMIYQDAEIIVQPESLQTEVDMMMKRLGWPTLGRDIIARFMYGGMSLEAIFPGPNGIYLRHWSGEWTFSDRGPDGSDEIVGYMYKLDEQGNRQPITDTPNKNDKYTYVAITPYYWVTVVNGQDTTDYLSPHNFGFTPAVMFYNIDVEDDEGYPIPFHIRFRDDLIEYNRMFSKVARDLRLLESFLATNKTKDQMLDNFIVDQEQIAFLGNEGQLWQGMSQYDIGPKRYFLDKLEKRMSTSAQVPDFMTGLEDVGKIDSGVALQIVHQPLIELVNHIINDVEPKFIELFSKCFAAELAMKGRADKFGLAVRFKENILPQDEQKKIDNIALSIDKGIITPQEARPVVLPMLDIEEQETTTQAEATTSAG